MPSDERRLEDAIRRGEFAHALWLIRQMMEATHA